MGAAEVEGQAAKKSNGRRMDGSRRRGGRADEQVRVEVGQHWCCLVSALAIWSKPGQGEWAGERTRRTAEGRSE